MEGETEMPVCPFDGISMPCVKSEIKEKIGDYGARTKYLVNRYVCEKCGMIVKEEFEIVRLFDANKNRM